MLQQWINYGNDFKLANDKDPILGNHAEINGREVREYIESEKGNYNEYYDGMYEAIRNNKPLPVTAEDGVKVIKIIEAAYMSSQTKRVVKL